MAQEAKIKRRTAGRKKPQSAAALKPSSSDRVVRGIIDELLAGRYVPGQKLIEADLTRKFDLSRGPIREALKRLAAEGVIRLTPHRGAFIRSFARSELYEMLTILETLVGLMARLAAEAVKLGNDPKPISEALELLEPYKEPGAIDLSYIERRRNFYETLVQIGGNRQLARIMPSVEIHIIRAQFLPFLTDKEHVARLNEYAEITNAVLEGDPRKAERSARKHIVETKKRISRCPDSAFAEGE